MSFADFWPIEYGGFPIQTVIGKFLCFFALSLLTGNTSSNTPFVNSFSFQSSYNWNVSVSTTPSKGIYSFFPIISWNVSSILIVAI